MTSAADPIYINRRIETAAMLERSITTKANKKRYHTEEFSTRISEFAKGSQCPAPEQSNTNQLFEQMSIEYAVQLQTSE